MEGLIGGNGAGEEVPRRRMWYEVGGQLEIPLARLLRIRQQRTHYDNPDYWRRLRREQREREAMQREEEEQEVAVNRVAEDEAVLANNELQEEAIVEAVQAEVEVDERVIDASNEVEGDVDGHGGDGFEAENALEEEEILERVEVTDNAAGGGGGEEDQEEVEGGAVIFDLHELDGLVECEGDEVEHGTFEEGSVKTGEDKLEVNVLSHQKVTEDDKIESQTDNENHVKDPQPPKKKKRNPVIPDHVSVLHGNPLTPKTFQCRICDKGFISRGQRDYHSLQHKNPHKCIFCDKEFYQQEHLNRHLRFHTRERPYMCQECPGCFRSIAELKAHDTAIHKAKGSKAFPCPHCLKRFDTKIYLNRHISVSEAHGLKCNRRFECVECGKAFGSRSSLNQHVRRLHLKERPHKCNLCSRAFFWPKALREHVCKGSQAYLCHQCPKRFHTQACLNNHVFNKHANRKFECVQCGRAFGVKSYLDQHVRTVHSDERPHQCQLCTRAFSVQKDLRRHLLTHTNERKLKCHICDKGFNRKDNLDRHIRTQHGVAKVATAEGESKA